MTNHRPPAIKVSFHSFSEVSPCFFFVFLPLTQTADHRMMSSKTKRFSANCNFLSDVYSQFVFKAYNKTAKTYWLNGWLVCIVCPSAMFIWIMKTGCWQDIFFPHTNAEHTYISAASWPFCSAVSSGASYVTQGVPQWKVSSLCLLLVSCGQLGVSGPCVSAACLGEVERFSPLSL